MTTALPRTNFNSSRLTRLLADLAVVDAPAAGHAFAERLGLWLDVNDAITLYSAHEAIGARPAAGNGATTAHASVAAEIARVRNNLTNAITKSCSPNAGETRIKLPTPKAGVPLEIVVAYEPYRRFYLAHQRDIELALRPLRAQVREAIAQSSPALRKLAALDAALDTILGERESHLLSMVPTLLQRRYDQRLLEHRQTYQQTSASADDVDDPATWMQPGGWLAGFCKELQDVLLAELDVRLQPILGLMEAFNETTKQQ